MLCSDHGVRVRTGSGFERVNPAQNVNFNCYADLSLTVRNQGVGAADTSAPGAGQQHAVQTAPHGALQELRVPAIRDSSLSLFESRVELRPGGLCDFLEAMFDATCVSLFGLFEWAKMCLAFAVRLLLRVLPHQVQVLPMTPYFISKDGSALCHCICHWASLEPQSVCLCVRHRFGSQI